MADKIDYRAYDETLGSDHFQLAIDVDIQKSIYESKSFKLKSLRTDWQQLNENLESEYSRFLTYVFDSSSPSAKYEMFLKKIQDNVVKVTPRKKSFRAGTKKKIRNPVPWWDEECARIKRLRRASFKKWEYTQRLIDLIQYKKNCAIAKRTFKQKEKQYFRKFASTINFRASKGFVWNKVKVLNNALCKVVAANKMDKEEFQVKCKECLTSLYPMWVRNDPLNIPICEKNYFLTNLLVLQK